MPDALLTLLVPIAALASALVAGVFLAFSTFVVRALARLPDAAGVGAMQAINVAVLTPGFLGVFLGAALAGVALLVDGAMRPAAPGAPARVAGALLYLVGTLLPTVARNVPLNDALAPLPPDAPATAAAWRSYVARWTRWNHVRTAGALLAAVAWLLAR